MSNYKLIPSYKEIDKHGFVSVVEGHQKKDVGLGLVTYTEIYYEEDLLYFLETTAYVSKH